MPKLTQKKLNPPPSTLSEDLIYVDDTMQELDRAQKVGLLVDAAGMGEFEKGWEGSRIGEEVNYMLSQANKAEIEGRPETAAVIKKQAADLANQAALLSPRVKNFTDIGGAKDLADWAAGSAGNLRSSIKPALAGLAGAAGGAIAAPFTGGIVNPVTGGMAAASAVAVPMAHDEIVANAMQDPDTKATPEEINKRGWMYGVPSGLLDSVVPAGVGKALTGIGKSALKEAMAGITEKSLLEARALAAKSGREVSEAEIRLTANKLADKNLTAFARELEAKEFAEKGAARYIAEGMAKEGGEEFLTDGAQDLLGQQAQIDLNGGEGQWDVKQAFNAGMAGAIPGMGMGGAGHIGAAARFGLVDPAVEKAAEIKNNPTQAAADGLAALGTGVGKAAGYAKHKLDEALHAREARQEAERMGLTPEEYNLLKHGDDSAVELLLRQKSNNVNLNNVDKLSAEEQGLPDVEKDKVLKNRADTLAQQIISGDSRDYTEQERHAATQYATGQIEYPQFVGALRNHVAGSTIDNITNDFKANMPKKSMMNATEQGKRAIAIATNWLKDEGSKFELFQHENAKVLAAQMVHWVYEGMPGQIPKRLIAELGGDAVTVIKSIAERVGQYKDVDPKRLNALTRVVSRDAEMRSSYGAFIDSMLTKEAHAHWDDAATSRMDTFLTAKKGEVSPAVRAGLEDIFGKNTDKVLDYYSRKQSENIRTDKLADTHETASTVQDEGEGSDGLSYEEQGGNDELNEATKSSSEYFDNKGGYWDVSDDAQRFYMSNIAKDKAAVNSTDGQVHTVSEVGKVTRELELAEEEKGAPLTPFEKDAVRERLVREHFPDMVHVAHRVSSKASEEYRQQHAKEREAYLKKVASRARVIDRRYKVLRRETTEMIKGDDTWSKSEVDKLRVDRDLRSSKGEANNGTLILQRESATGKEMSPFITTTQMILAKVFGEGSQSTSEYRGAPRELLELLKQGISRIVSSEGGHFTGEFGTQISGKYVEGLPDQLQLFLRKSGEQKGQRITVGDAQGVGMVPTKEPIEAGEDRVRRPLHPWEKLQRLEELDVMAQMTKPERAEVFRAKKLNGKLFQLREDFNALNDQRKELEGKAHLDENLAKELESVKEQLLAKKEEYKLAKTDLENTVGGLFAEHIGGDVTVEEHRESADQHLKLDMYEDGTSVHRFNDQKIERDERGRIKASDATMEAGLTVGTSRKSDKVKADVKSEVTAAKDVKRQLTVPQSKEDISQIKVARPSWGISALSDNRINGEASELDVVTGLLAVNKNLADVVEHVVDNIVVAEGLPKGVAGRAVEEGGRTFIILNKSIFQKENAVFRSKVLAHETGHILSSVSGFSADAFHALSDFAKLAKAIPEDSDLGVELNYPLRVENRTDLSSTFDFKKELQAQLFSIFTLYPEELSRVSPELYLRLDKLYGSENSTFADLKHAWGTEPSTEVDSQGDGAEGAGEKADSSRSGSEVGGVAATETSSVTGVDNEAKNREIEKLRQAVIDSSNEDAKKLNEQSGKKTRADYDRDSYELSQLLESHPNEPVWSNAARKALETGRGIDGALAAAKKRFGEVSSDAGKTEGRVKRSNKNSSTLSEKFKRWFGDSKVVDSNGNPLKLYHGTAGDITQFKKGRAGLIFLATDPKFANSYAFSRAEQKSGIPEDEEEFFTEGINDANVMPVYAKATKIFDAGDLNYNIVETHEFVQKLKDAGYDGMWIRENGYKNLAVFDPSQIKSATGNNGEYSSNTSDIRHSKKDSETQRLQDENEADLAERELAEEHVLDKFAHDGEQEVRRLLGDSVDFQGVRNMGHDGEHQEHATKNLIRAALNAAIVGTARHEAVHELFTVLKKHGAQAVTEALESIKNNKLIMTQLDRALNGHPEAQKQLADGEEAAAFLFQFWKDGTIEVGPKVKTLFEKVQRLLLKAGSYFSEYLREKLNKLETEEAQQEFLHNIFTTFDSGAFASADEAVTQAAVAKMKKDAEGYTAAQKNLNKSYEQMVEKVGKFFMSNEATIEASGSKDLIDILKRFNQKAGDAMMAVKPVTEALASRVKGTFFDAARREANYRMNMLNNILSKYDIEDHNLAREGLSKGVRPTAQAAGKLYDEITTYLDDMGKYMTEMDVRRLNTDTHSWEKVELRKGYGLPQVWDQQFVMDHIEDFKADLKRLHSAELESMAKESGSSVDQIIDAITTSVMNNGAKDHAETASEMGFTPAAAAVNRRALSWLDKEGFDKYKSQNLAGILSSYTHSMIKRAEYQARFGYDGGEISGAVDKAILRELGGDELVDEAVASLPRAIEQWKKDMKNWAKTPAGPDKGPRPEKPTLRSVGRQAFNGTKEDYEAAIKKMELPIKGIQALEGTLGSDISPTTRNINSWINAYQTFRLLPTMLFTSFADVNNVLVQGRSLGEAWDTFVSGIKGIRDSMKDLPPDERMRRSEMWGVADATSFADTLGEAYGSNYMTGKAKKWTDQFFKFTGAEGWNRGIRAAATAIGEKVLLEMKNGKYDMSVPYQKAMVERLFGKGFDPANIALDEHGQPDLNDMANRAAMQRWVLDTMVTPNAAHRPTWASDPHYSTLIHLKQFTYTQHRVVLKAALEQARLGNYSPIMAHAIGAIPIMIAAGMVKEALLPGDEPKWMKSGVGAAFGYGFDRAGPFGISQMYMSSLMPGKHFDPAAALGPIYDEVQGLGSMMIGQEGHEFLPEIAGDLPGGVVFKKMVR